MKTQELLKLLETQKNKSLLFEYTAGKFVGANYHITEIKNTTIDSVDCGGRPDDWKETVIQLWESPLEKDKTEYMNTFKALSILKKVDEIKPMVRDAEVKFEYSNENFHTAQLFVNDYSYNDNKLIINLGVEKTDCKAKELCGVPEPVEQAIESNGCAPGSGCC
ncbi:hypothetical protein GCM10011414_08700 [Croceivirga lutea]|uniref:DUF6428 family protein n=1 Tax=Croceivirga lutea TaxID=1775167 RepID=UPI00163B2E1F|nr:DUF6428 family protein [Croceivirga lutea]GGG41448.1 hypothetical protein GCM10011414_08700 [Croceivirga lutea]